MSTEDKKDLHALAMEVYNKIIAMQEECKSIRLATEAFLNK